MPIARTACKARCFTLVELLLVISIISLLLGIVIPSLSHAKQAAKRTLCLNNLHQIGTATAGYFGQHADALRHGHASDAGWSAPAVWKCRGPAAIVSELGVLEARLRLVYLQEVSWLS